MISGIVYLNPCYNEEYCVKEKIYVQNKATGEIVMSKLIFVDYLALLK